MRAFANRGRFRSAAWPIAAVAATVLLTRPLAVLAQNAFSPPNREPAVDAPRIPKWHYFPSRPLAPHGAPNVLLIMTDDVGFSAGSTFGGPIPTPALDALAAQGLKYNRFHTTAMCSPTRAALLTGRNHHSVGFGALADFATDSPGYDAYIPKSDDIIAEVLKANGYDTAWIGKNHNTPPWESSRIGPFEHWPNGEGFDYFFGFNAAMTNQYAPDLVENRTFINPPHTAGYILEKDLANHAVAWLRNQANIDPSHPFFLYYASGSTHSPHQAPPEWIDKFKGQFTEGWDKMREETFARQKAAGIIPASAKLTPRPAQIPAWDSMNAQQKVVETRLMQVYAADLAYSDYQIGRVIEQLRASGQLQNTLIFFIEGDNGAAAEDLNGTTDDTAGIGGIEGNFAYMETHLADMGGPKTFENYSVGWAWSMDSPFQWAKEVASHFGGTRNGLVVSWQGHMTEQTQMRSQFHHIIDIAPTIYEAAGIKPPAELNGVKQSPLQGVSMLYTFTHPDAPSTHHSQYFEMLGNRAFYKDGWIASTTPEHMPWSHSPGTENPYKYKWELYDLNNDYSQADNLAARRPDKLAELQRGFDAAEKEFHILPLDADVIGRLNPDLRPSLTAGRDRFVYYPSDSRYVTAELPSFNGTWRINADVQIQQDGTSGTIVMRGDWLGGWGLMTEGGRPVFVLRASDQAQDMFKAESTVALAPGHHTIRVNVHRTPQQPGGEADLIVDGQAVAHTKIERFGLAYGDMFVGRTGYLPLIDGQPVAEQFSGVVDKVELDTGAAAAR